MTTTSSLHCECEKTLPKVGIYCNTEDIALYFEQLSCDVLDAVNCAILPVFDEVADFTEVEFLIVAITNKMLASDTLVTERILEQTKQYQIPVLPIVLEEGLVARAREVFGSRYILDITDRKYFSSPYKNKLIYVLSTVLLSEQKNKELKFAELLTKGVGVACDPKMAIKLYEQTEGQLRKSYENNKTAENACAYLKMLSDLGYAWDNYHQKDKAMEVFGRLHSEALRIFNEIGDNEVKCHIAAAHKSLAYCLYYLDKNDDAKEHCRKAISITDDLVKQLNHLEARRIQREIYGRLGYICRDENELDKAQEYAQKALDIANDVAADTDDDYDVKNVWNYTRLLSVVIRKLKDYEKARALCGASIDGLLAHLDKTRDEKEVRTALSTSYHVMGNICEDAGDREACLNYYMQVAEVRLSILEEYESLEARSIMAQICLALGNYYEDEKVIIKAEEYYLLAYDLRDSIFRVTEAASDIRSLANSVSKLGNLYYNSNNYSSAKEYRSITFDLRKRYAKLINDEQAKRELSTACDKISNVYIMLGEYKKAKEYLTEGIEYDKDIIKKYGYKWALNNLKTKYGRMEFICGKQNDIVGQIGYLDLKLDIWKEIYTDEDRKKLMAEYGRLGGLCYDQCDYALTVKAYENMLSLAEKLKVNDDFMTPRDKGVACYVIGNAYSEMKDTDMASGYLQRAVSILKDISDASGETDVRGFTAASLFCLGEVAYMRNDRAAVREDMQNVVQLLSGIPWEELTSDESRYLRLAYQFLGDTYLDENDMKNAMKFYPSAYDIAWKTAQNSKTVGAYNELADLQYRIGICTENINQICEAIETWSVNMEDYPEDSEYYSQLIKEARTTMETLQQQKQRRFWDRFRPYNDND